MIKKYLVAALACLSVGHTYGQKQQYKVLAIGSYNCENLFDTLDDPTKKDEDFTPAGGYTYTGDVYRAKLHNIATVLQKMGTDFTPDGPAVVGLVEVENSTVLHDLVAQPEIKNRNYQPVWFPTSDERGISTAFLYNPKYFQKLGAEPHRVPMEDIGQTRPTRDVLHVYGVIAGDTIHFLVNHWPSKSGGEAASAPGRKLAATVAKKIVDSLTAINPNAKVILMGDLNDNPTSEGVIKVLKAQSDKDKVGQSGIYNPWIDMYNKGIGTESYQGEWNLIDQIMVTGGVMKNPNNKWKYYNAEIFNRDFLVNKIGKDKGLPHRSFTIARVWDNGYSDHFPVLIYLVSK